MQNPNPYAQFAASLTQGLQGVQTQINAILESARPGIEALNRFHAQFAKQIERINQAGPAVVRFIEHLQRLPEQHREAYRTLAAHGWYLDPEMPATALEALAHEFKTNAPVVHAELCQYYEGRLDEIERRLRRKMRTRAPLLSAALAAHRRKEYILSIPVLLAQADGYCHERTGRQLYSPKKAKLATAFRANKDGFRKATLTPLLEKTPLNGHTSEFKNHPDVLNRHGILHGLWIDYGTQLNSCRCLSLLVFLTWVLEKRRKHPKHRRPSKTAPPKYPHGRPADPTA